VRPVVLDQGCRRAFDRPTRAFQAPRDGRYGKSCSPWARQVKRGACRPALRRCRVVGGRLACTGQASGTQWRTALRHLRRPPPQVLEDATDDSRILDSSAMNRIGPLHFGHSKRIGLVHLANEPRPRRLRAQAQSLASSSLCTGGTTPAWGDAFFARSPRARFEYTPRSAPSARNDRGCAGATHRSSPGKVLEIYDRAAHQGWGPHDQLTLPSDWPKREKTFGAVRGATVRACPRNSARPPVPRALSPRTVLPRSPGARA